MYSGETCKAIYMIDKMMTHRSPARRAICCVADRRLTGTNISGARFWERFKNNPQVCSRGSRKTFKRIERCIVRSAFKSGNKGLWCIHKFGKLFLCPSCFATRINDSGCKLSWILTSGCLSPVSRRACCQRVAIPRVLPPPQPPAFNISPDLYGLFDQKPPDFHLCGVSLSEQWCI